MIFLDEGYVEIPDICRINKIHGVVDETYQSKSKSSQPIGYSFPFMYAYIGYIYWKNKERLK